MNLELLEEIGLTKSERELYITLLKLGSSPSGKITKEVDMHRSRVYESLNRLMEKGLVSYVIKNNVKHFQAASPDRLLTYVEEQESKLAEKKKELHKLIPEIKHTIDPLKPEAEAHVLTGPEGFKTMRKDVLRVNKDMYLIGGKGKEYHLLGYFFPQFERERLKQRVKWHVLYDYGVKEKDKMAKRPLMVSRSLPKEYITPTVVNIYGDRVVNVLWKGNYPLCFMIINKDIADSYRKWFELLWKYSHEQ